MERAVNNLSHKSLGKRIAQRWGVVVACASLMAVSSGAWYTGSLFFVAIIKEFGWDYASTASIFSLFTVLYGAWNILVGYLVDRFGPRPVVVAGGLLLPLALTGTGSAHAVWHLYVTHSLLTSLGLSAMSYVPVSLILTRRFRKEPGLGLSFGIASAGVGIGILVLVPLAQVLISGWGWRVAYRCLAMIAALVVLPVGLFGLKGAAPAKERDESAAGPALATRASNSPDTTLVSAVLTREFWLVAATLVFLNAPIGFILTHHVAHMVEVGQSEMLVAGIVGLIGLCSIPARIGWGFLSDRLWLELIYLAGSGCVASAILILVAISSASSIMWLYAYAIVMGSGYAVAASMNPILAGRFFTGRNFGVILGTLSTFYHGGAAAGIWLAGYAHDLTGSYRTPLLGGIASVCLAAGCVWLAAPRRIAPQRVA